MNPLRPVAVRLGGQPWVPRFTKHMVWLDRRLQRASDGRVTLAGLLGLPSLLLTVTGRRSGLPRTTPLLYVPHRGGYAVAGSNWGGGAHPAWVLNLQANPDATVAVRGRRRPVRAREVTGEERARVWRALVRTWPAYATYADRAGRPIPVFVLEPSG